MGDHGKVNLPPGFHFCPTDEELVLHFLHPKASRLSCHPDFIPVLDSYPLDPWELDGKALASENQWYFFGQMMQNQAITTTNGFWKQLDIEEPVLSSTTNRTVGMKRNLVFYINDGAQGGIETNWVMQEYRLCNYGSSNSLYNKRKMPKKSEGNNLVLCRVYERKSDSQSFCYNNEDDDDDGTELSCLDEMFLSLDDDLDDISLPN
ncbi:NAC transcription factor ONAC-like [Tripterygium wilfordii]|uniref:NAC transcription factor ONAC-like n=1 Tax=Tripterygium wilfordii TaxID=458696 RepID=A0A7J7C0M1_TRIWF|nr:NAC domain-containing protein 104-like [Tripterygium wilfordii]KAF5727652.1 NAC transcription factor ONAC-like [Tripterygium wilfordii]